jgi:RNA polymerase sigma-70 factor, ECF subfamily
MMRPRWNEGQVRVDETRWPVLWPNAEITPDRSADPDACLLSSLVRGSSLHHVLGRRGMTADPAALFAAHRHRLFRYFCRAVGEPDTANDLTQEVFLRVTRTAIPAGADGDVKAWLFRIARHLAIDHHRTRARRPPPSELRDEAARLPSQDVDLAVNEALATLPDLDRDVFLMRELAGLGYEEIARACELTPDAVRSRIHRARLELRARLAAPIATRRTIRMRQSGREP